MFSKCFHCYIWIYYASLSVSLNIGFPKLSWFSIHFCVGKYYHWARQPACKYVNELKWWNTWLSRIFIDLLLHWYKPYFYQAESFGVSIWITMNLHFLIWKLKWKHSWKNICSLSRVTIVLQKRTEIYSVYHTMVWSLNFFKILIGIQL